MELAGRILTVEVGRVAKQANGAAFMHYGDTVVLSTATASVYTRRRTAVTGMLTLMISLRNLPTPFLGACSVERPGLSSDTERAHEICLHLHIIRIQKAMRSRFWTRTAVPRMCFGTQTMERMFLSQLTVR